MNANWLMVQLNVNAPNATRGSRNKNSESSEELALQSVVKHVEIDRNRLPLWLTRQLSKQLNKLDLQDPLSSLEGHLLLVLWDVLL